MSSNGNSKKRPRQLASARQREKRRADLVLRELQLGLQHLLLVQDWHTLHLEEEGEASEDSK